MIFFQPLTLITLVTVLLAGCSRGKPIDDPLAGVEEVRYLSSEQSEDICPTAEDCPPRVVDMCSVSSNSDVLMFVEVQTSTYVHAPCGEGLYVQPHYEQKLSVLAVAGGTYLPPTIDNHVIWAGGIATEVGDTALIALRYLDGIWHRIDAVPIELVADEGDPLDQPDDDIDTIYNLPSNINDFKHAAQTLWANYENECGQPRKWRSDDELRATRYAEEECPQDPFPQESDPPPDVPTD